MVRLVRILSFGARARCLTVLALAALTVGPAPVAAQERLSQVDPSVPRAAEPGAPGAFTIGGQVALGTLATPIGYFGGGLATRKVAQWVGAGDDLARRAAYVGAYSGATFATATTVHYLGRTGNVSGSYLATAGGAVAGGLASWGLVEFGRSRYREGVCTIVCRIVGISAFVLPSVGATVGHAMTREWR